MSRWVGYAIAWSLIALFSIVVAVVAVEVVWRLVEWILKLPGGLPP